jgi:hypothetical protein
MGSLLVKGVTTTQMTNSMCSTQIRLAAKPLAKPIVPLPQDFFLSFLTYAATTTVRISEQLECARSRHALLGGQGLSGLDQGGKKEGGRRGPADVPESRHQAVQQARRRLSDRVALGGSPAAHRPCRVTSLHLPGHQSRPRPGHPLVQRQGLPMGHPSGQDQGPWRRPTDVHFEAGTVLLPPRPGLQGDLAVGEGHVTTSSSCVRICCDNP